MKKTIVLAIIAIFLSTSAWAGKTIKNAPGGKRTAAQLTNTMAFPLDAGTADYWTDLAEHYLWIKTQTDLLYASKPWYDGAATQGSIIKFYGPSVANGGHGTYTSIQGADYVGDEGTGIQWRLPITYPATGVTGIFKTDSLGNMAVTSVTGNSKYVGTDSGGTYGVFDLPSGESMTYPGSGIPNSTGSAWGTSYSLDTDLASVSGGDDSIPSAKATKSALDGKQAVLTNPVTGPASPTAGMLAKWGPSGQALVDGLKLGTLTDAKYCTYTTANGLVCNSDGSGAMTYPGAGIPNSTGSAWGTSYALDTDLSSVSASDDSIPSAKATKSALDGKASTSGTSSSTFQVGTGGPKLKNSSGVVEARNAADDAYADIKGKDAYFAHIYSTGADGTYYGNNDNTVSITFTPAQGDFWSESGVPYFRDATTNRKMLHAGSSAADFPTLNQNTTGTASNVSGTPALPNGTTATTQTQADNSTKLATTAYVDAGLSGKQATLTMATASDINTGTDTAKPLTSDALAGSNLGIKEIGWTIKDSDVATAVADGKQAFVVPAAWNGMNLVDLTCAVADLNSAASGDTTVVLRRVRGATAADMTSTGVTIAYNEYSASDETVDTSNDDIQTGDKIYVDVNAITTAAHKGLSCTASFQLP